MDGRKMTARIPCTPEVQKTLREFSLGIDMTYDEVLRFFLHRFVTKDDDPYIAGRDLREQAEQWKTKQIGE